MADDQNKGWTNDPEGHSRTGSQSSGNQNPTPNMSDEERSKGGKASYQNEEEAEDAGRMGKSS